MIFYSVASSYLQSHDLKKMILKEVYMFGWKRSRGSVGGELHACTETPEAVERQTRLDAELKIGFKIHIDPHAILMRREHAWLAGVSIH